MVAGCTIPDSCGYRLSDPSSRPVKNSTYSSPFVLLYSLLQPPVRRFNFPGAVIKCSSVVHVIRIHAIYDKSRTVLFGLGSLYAAQIVVTAICCAFYRCGLLLTKISPTLTCSSAVPLQQGQGCIAGPKAAWVGIYWLVPTLLYTASVGPMTSIMRCLPMCIPSSPSRCSALSALSRKSPCLHGS
jgi:hypothetical protein